MGVIGIVLHKNIATFRLRQSICYRNRSFVLTGGIFASVASRYLDKEAPSVT